VPVVVVSCRVEVRPADADEDVGQTLCQQLHLPIMLALSDLSPSSCQ
jgi:hypothetical protein